MKKLLLSIFLITVCANSFATIIYCPESFVCDQQGCHIPKDFYLDFSIRAKPDKDTYAFKHAIFSFTDGSYRRGKATCLYENISKNIISPPITLSTYQSITPRMGSGTDWMFTGNYTAGCSRDVYHCPFYG